MDVEMYLCLATRIHYTVLACDVNYWLAQRLRETRLKITRLPLVRQIRYYKLRISNLFSTKSKF